MKFKTCGSILPVRRRTIAELGRAHRWLLSALQCHRENEEADEEKEEEEEELVEKEERELEQDDI